MTDTPASQDFALGRALGFWFAVLKARPTGFVVVAVYAAAITAVGQLLLGLIVLEPTIALLEDPAATGEAPPARLLADLAGAIVFGLAVALAATALAEVAWMRLFALGETRLTPGLGAARIFVVLLAAYGGAVGLAVFVSVAASLLGALLSGIGGPILASLLSFFGFVGGLAAALWFGARIAPAAALTVHDGRIALARAWRGTGPIFWSLLGALFVAALILIPGFFVSALAQAAAPGPEVGAVSGEPEDLAAVYRTYLDMISTPGGAATAWAGVLIAQLVSTPFASVLRGVGARAALDIADADAEPGEPDA